MEELERWFGLLADRLGHQNVGPSDDEVKILLEMGKVAAEEGPQRYFALLTAFAVGRALGWAENKGEINSVEFLRSSLAAVKDVAALKDAE